MKSPACYGFSVGCLMIVEGIASTLTVAPQSFRASRGRLVFISQRSSRWH